jgi:hypothetical protein
MTRKIDSPRQRAWTDQEVETLYAMRRKFATYAEIGVAIDRSTSAVEGKARLLGLTRGTPREQQRAEPGWPILRGSDDERHDLHCRQFLAGQLRERFGVEMAA